MQSTWQVKLYGAYESNSRILSQMPVSSAFLWRYEPVRHTGKSDDWLTFFCSHNKVHCSEIPIVLSNLLYHYFFHWSMAQLNFVISQNAKWGHAGFYVDCHRMTVPENILLQKKHCRLVSPSYHLFSSSHLHISRTMSTESIQVVIKTFGKVDLDIPRDTSPWLSLGHS